ncbi:cyclase family protein [Dactylosporangium aurantiacum]|uniref:Cyclase family protein n=1 Tax=Dactylosporangium aurantiacum TaxID=35754 RepID=A0A9Q9IED2_9ACTN|nr:cyclase family protein [Dactylosporangium aurantiacum]MDG6101233.1 cyclase family protein [Dactylosporangium aurantiacum]UWZ54749.1 cyclase family protein [Dactylosporangium aurantiacum]
MIGVDRWLKAVVDLSHPLSPGFPGHPSTRPPRAGTVADLAHEGCFKQRWDLDEHSGTHLDAPAHFLEGGRTVDLLPAEDLVLCAAVVDLRPRAAADPDALVEVEDVLAWEREHGELPRRCAVLAQTGWSSRVGDRLAYHGIDGDGLPHWPGFAPATAAFLVRERPQVTALGVDTPSLDSAGNERAGCPVHRTWLHGRRFGLEHLTNLAALPAAGAAIVVGAVSLAGGSGAPARVLGLVPTAG